MLKGVSGVIRSSAKCNWGKAPSPKEKEDICDRIAVSGEAAGEDLAHLVTQISRIFYPSL